MNLYMTEKKESKSKDRDSVSTYW